MGSEDAYVELSFSPNVSLISTVRRFVGEFYSRVLKDGSIASRLGVATHELLENAVRYSTDGQSAIRIAVANVASNELEVTIDTRNRTSADNLARLEELLREMASHGDRGSFYQVLLRRTAKQDTGSGLGLGRIHAEAELDLTTTIEGEMVLLRAAGRFPMEARR